MGSHPKTYHRIYLAGLAGDDTKNISCDINSDVTVQAKNLKRGTNEAKIQHWEILYYPQSGTVQFRNCYDVFLGVETFVENAKIKANAGIDTNQTHWRLEADGKIAIASLSGTNTLYMKLNGNDVVLSTEATAWDIIISDGVPPGKYLQLINIM
jgi:hypothetical protein